MTHKPIEEHLSQYIDALNNGDAPAPPSDDPELAELATDALKIKAAFSRPVLSESLEQRVWARVRAEISAPPEPQPGLLARVRWALLAGGRRRLLVPALLALLAAAVAAAVYVPKVRRARLAAAAGASIRFASPRSGELLRGAVNVVVTCKGEPAPLRTMIYLDGQRIATLNQVPCRLTWDSQQASNGHHELTAVCSSGGGGVWLTTIPVTVSNRLIAPGRLRGLVVGPNGAAVPSARVRISGPSATVLATDAYGAFQTQGISPGRYVVAAWAAGLGGTSVPVTVAEGRDVAITIHIGRQKAETRRSDVKAQLAPRLMHPFDGAVVRSAVPVVFQPPAAQEDLLRVEVEIDGSRRFEAARPPYNWMWDTTELPDGSHLLSFRAFDSHGGVRTYDARITVANETLPPAPP